MLGVDLGIMIAVGVPTGILSLIFAGILWSKFIGTKIHTDLPISVSEIGEEEEAKLPEIFNGDPDHSCTADTYFMQYAFGIHTVTGNDPTGTSVCGNSVCSTDHSNSLCNVFSWKETGL